MNPGLLATLAAFLIWGLFPLYWKLLEHIPAVQIMAHRLVWCFVLVAAFLLLRRGAGWWRAIVVQPRLVTLLSVTALLISANWWLYIWAVNNGHIVETSLGYFINPLVNVLLGVMILKERLNPRQWLAIAIAALGVAWLTLQVGHLPWIALALAFSFGTYGLLRKIAVVESVPALGFESSVLFLPALGFLLWLEFSGAGGFGDYGVATDLLLIGGGLVTALPLALFAFGAQRIPYSMVGVLQYIAPTLQLLCGVVVFGEPFTTTQAVGFSCIWLALAIYAGDGLVRLRRARHPD
jgi:chloramphenicol-sensitive protein RarD